MFQENPTKICVSELQKKFLEESSYHILTQGGRKFQRTFELLAFNALSGKILVKEKVSYSDDNYEKVYILTSNGETEKVKANE
jgi:hypothetical protein